MLSGIFLIGNDGELTEMRETVYESEDILQELIAKYPNLLAGDQTQSAETRRWILVSRELPVPDEEGASGRWALDHLFIDQDAVPTLVEVKRSSDTRIRREVVGQLLDYAANGVVYWPIEDIRESFFRTCDKSHMDPDSCLAELLGPDGDGERFWEQVRMNLKIGKVRLVFVADRIPSELQRVVEFLNGQMNPAEVLAVEVKQYLGGSIRALSPRTVGVTASSQQSKGIHTPGARWTEERFFGELQKNAPHVVPVARKLFDWGQALDGSLFGRGKESGSFVPSLKKDGVVHYPFAVWTFGKVELYFSHYKSKSPFNEEEPFKELQHRLSAIEGITIPSAPKYPKLDLGVLLNPHTYGQFIDVFNWYVDVIRNGIT